MTRLTHEEAHRAFEEADERERGFAEEEYRATSHDLKAIAHRQRLAMLDVMERAGRLHESAAACSLCQETR